METDTPAPAEQDKAPVETDPAVCGYARRTAINRQNAQHSTGPRTEPGKQRSSLNALRHGLTAASPVLPSEDPAAYQEHRRKFFDEFKPANATESQFVQELVDTSWRLNRIPLLEAGALAGVLPPADPEQEATFDMVDASRVLAILGLHSGRLSRQFQKALDCLRELQSERAEREYHQLSDAAAMLQLHKRKRIPWQPSDDGFVFSEQRIQQFSERLARLEKAAPFTGGFSDSRQWLTSTPANNPPQPV